MTYRPHPGVGAGKKRDRGHKGSKEGHGGRIGGKSTVVGATKDVAQQMQEQVASIMAQIQPRGPLIHFYRSVSYLLLAPLLCFPRFL